MSDGTPILKRRGWVAALLSLLAPGAGHLYLGHRGRAAVFLLAPTTLMAAGVMFLFSSFSGFVATFLAAALFYIAVVVNAWIAARAGVERTQQPYWIEYALFFSATLVVGIVFRDFISNPNVESPTGVRYRIYASASHAMVPNLLPGDFYVVAVGKAPPVRNQIVAYQRRSHSKAVNIHRVVAIAGDTVKLDGGRLTVNGIASPQRRLCDLIDMQDATSLGGLFEEGAGAARRVVAYLSVIGDHQDLAAIVVPSDEFIVLGDDRNASLDSRRDGTVKASNVVGIVSYVLWSTDRSRIGSRLDETSDDDERRICSRRYNVFD